MGQINKGTIASVSGNTARVVPIDASAKPTAKITIPWHLRGGAGNLKKGTEVVYVEFSDATGLLLGRADGEWGEYLPRLRAETMEASGKITAGTVSASGGISGNTVSASGSVTAGSVSASGDVTAGDISLKTHKHGGVESGNGTTSAPQ